MNNAPNLGARADDHFIANNCNFAAPPLANQCNNDGVMIRRVEARRASCQQNGNTPENAHIKRPMNAFMCWAQVARRRLADEKPELRNTELSKILGQMWKELNKEQKTPYIMKAEQLRNQHKTQYPNYKYRPKRKRSSKFSIVPPPEFLRPKSGSLLGQEEKSSHNPKFLCDIVKEENVLAVNGDQASTKPLCTKSTMNNLGPSLMEDKIEVHLSKLAVPQSEVNSCGSALLSHRQTINSSASTSPSITSKSTSTIHSPPTAFSQLQTGHVSLIGTNNSILSHAGYPKTYQTLPHQPETTDDKSVCPLMPYIHYSYTND